MKKYIVKVHHNNGSNKYIGYLSLKSEYDEESKDLGFYCFGVDEDKNKAEEFSTKQLAKMAIMLGARNISSAIYEIIDVADDYQKNETNKTNKTNVTKIYNIVEQCLCPDGNYSFKVLKSFTIKKHADEVAREMNNTNIIELSYEVQETELIE